MTTGTRLLELFSGLGAASLAWGGPVAAAIDQDEDANAAYTLNHGGSPRRLNLARVTEAQLAEAAAGRWWLSPPCQPYTARGAARDLDDPRAAALLHLIPLVVRLRPAVVALENVPGFVPSRSRGELRAALIGAGYRLRERLACPSALGVPMRRVRYYLVATRDDPAPHEADFTAPAAIPPTRPLAGFLDPDPDPALYLPEATVRGFGHSADIVDAADAHAIANCFTSAYGRSPVRAGSYVRDRCGVRRFSPEEVVELLGFPAGFRFPDAFTVATRWALAGNSLAIPAVRAVLDAAGVLPTGVGDTP
jgi:site-specific DNA-cytosine methylase